MFVSIELATRIEHVEAGLSADIGNTVLSRTPVPDAFVEEVGGGYAVYAGPDSPATARRCRPKSLCLPSRLGTKYSAPGIALLPVSKAFWGSICRPPSFNAWLCGICTVVVLSLTGFSHAAAQSRILEPEISWKPPSYVCYRAAAPIRIDGNISDEVWASAPWSEAFVDIEGSSRPKPRYLTRFKMLWDDTGLYIGADLEEPDIWATLTKRDSIIFQDNDFEIFIDPDGDTHNYYEIEMNALNTVWDLFLVRPYRDGGPAIHSWDISGLQSAVRIEGTLNKPGDKDGRWFVEMVLPWEVLKEAARPKAAPKPGDQWRLNYSRVEYRLATQNNIYKKALDPDTNKPYQEDNWVWAPSGLINIHYPEMWGYLQFSGVIAGQGSEEYQDRQEEKAKWALRRIYYREWARRGEKSAFTSDLAALGLPEMDLRLKGFAFPPAIQTTRSQFEATYQSESGEIWHITQDGRVWRDK
jgi:hypothetical protein